MPSLLLLGYIWTSDTWGATWVERSNATAQRWYAVASSSNGSVLVAAAAKGGIYVSKDQGLTWSNTTSLSKFWKGVACSANCTYILATHKGSLYTSWDTGSTWVSRKNSSNQAWTIPTVSSTGASMAACAYNNFCLTSNTFGRTWANQTGSGRRYWTSVASSSDFSVLVGSVSGGYLYLSLDKGVSWQQMSSGTATWTQVACSSSGSRLVAAQGDTNKGYVYTHSLATSSPTVTPTVIPTRVSRFPLLLVIPSMPPGFAGGLLLRGYRMLTWILS